VTDLKRERLEAEDRGWAELRSLVDPLTPERMDRDGYYEDWSVKDLLAHLGSWMAEAGTILEQIRMGTFDDSPVDVDGLNARWYETWRDQDLRTVWSELHSARARMLDEWDRLPEVTDKADEWFRESGEDHYAEHLPRLRQWVTELAG
jgi:Mycothiol maleylpyruvate isomerase N-terminal domain